MEPIMLALLVNNTHLEGTNYKYYLEKLPLMRQHKLLSYKFECDFLASLAGDLLLDYGLKEFYGITKRPNVLYGKYDKPYFKNTKIDFNISHSGDYTICAIGNSPVGIDIQKMDDIAKEQIMLIAKQFFSSDEAKLLDTVDNKIDLFYSFWCLKESFVKYTGVGLSAPLDSFSFSLGDTKSIVEFCSHNYCHPNPNFFITSIEKQYKIAVCTEDNSFHIKHISASMLL